MGAARRTASNYRVCRNGESFACESIASCAGDYYRPSERREAPAWRLVLCKCRGVPQHLPDDRAAGSDRRGVD